MAFGLEATRRFNCTDYRGIDSQKFDAEKLSAAHFAQREA